MQKKDDSVQIFTKIPFLFLIYGIIGVLVGIVVLLIGAFLAGNEVLSESVIQNVPVAAVFIGTVISAYISSKSMGKALVTGGIQAIVNFTILYLLGGVVFIRIKPVGFYLYVFLACVAGAVVGSMLTTISGKKHRRRAS